MIAPVWCAASIVAATTTSSIVSLVASWRLK